MRETSHIETESMAVMRGEGEGAALRKACKDFDAWWERNFKPTVIANIFQFNAPEFDLRLKNIARLAYLEGKRL